MIVDMRTYTLVPGALGAFFKLYGSEGFGVQTSHLGQPMGYYFVEVGVQNRVVHFWRYADIAERERKRAAMLADPAWNSYRAKSAQFFHAQENRILKPAPFAPHLGEPIANPGIIDLRIYTLYSGKTPQLFKLYEAEGMATQAKHLGNCIGYYQVDIGGINQIVHLWGYADFADRTRRRMAMQADPAWNTYLAKSAPMLSLMENMIIRPAPFWTPKA